MMLQWTLRPSTLQRRIAVVGSIFWARANARLIDSWFGLGPMIVVFTKDMPPASYIPSKRGPPPGHPPLQKEIPFGRIRFFGSSRSSTDRGVP